jgi:phosphoribosyl-ATP pyrophosphohydrolase
MSDSVRTKLQASANGQNMRKRQSPKRKPLKKKELAQKPQVEIKETVSEAAEFESIEETANVLFHRLTFLQQVNVKYYTVVQQGVVNLMPCLQTL